MRPLSLPDKPILDLVLLAILLALFFGATLGVRPYSVPSEARYVEIGREMAASGDFITPRLNGVKYFEKPPLFYWIQAASTKLLGLSPFKARLPTMLFTVLLCLTTYGLGRILGDRLAGWLSALTLATSLYVFALSRVVLLDVPVSAFIVATLTAFLYAAHAPPSRRRTLILYAMYIAAACAVLTKGLIGAVLPGVVVFLWLAMTKRWSLLKEIRLISGMALFLLIAVPWHIIVSGRNPEFAHFYFIHEHLERYLTREHGRWQPDWFFAVVLIVGLFPWIVFAVQALKDRLRGVWQARTADGKPLFLLLWIAVIFIFFSLSDSKLIPYILPVFPPIAALIGCYLANAWREKLAPGFALGIGLMLVSLVLMALVPALLMQTLDPDNKILVALGQGGDEAHALSLASLIAAGLLFIVVIQGRTRHAVAATLAIAAMIAMLGDMVGAHYNKDSMQGIAGIIQSLHQPGDEVASYGTYYQDLPIYLDRRITVVDWQGELEFGMANENVSAWMIDGKEFWRRWLHGKHRMFVVMREGSYLQLTGEKDATALHLYTQRVVEDEKGAALHLYALGQDGRNVLFVNESPETLEKEALQKNGAKK